MKISTKSIIIILGILVAGNVFAYLKYGNAKPFYQYELVLKSKALLYDQLQQLSRKITSTTFQERDRFLNLSDPEKENIKNISYTSFKEEDYYVFSLKISTKDTSTLIRTADKILSVFYRDSYLKEKYFAQEEIARTLRDTYSRIKHQLDVKQDSTNLNSSMIGYDLEVKKFLFNHFHSSSQKELSLPEINSHNITFQRPDFSRVLIITNIVCLVLSTFVLISFKRNE